MTLDVGGGGEGEAVERGEKQVPWVCLKILPKLNVNQERLVFFPTPQEPLCSTLIMPLCLLLGRMGVAEI